MKLILGFFLSLAILLASSFGFAFSKAEALQISKGRIELLKNHFASLADICYQFNDECGITGRSQEAVVKWLSSEQSKNDPDIRYDSGADKFTIDGALRVAKTGDGWGSPVYFNEDLLTVENSAGNFQPLDFFEIVGILIHEFGHHQAQFLAHIGLPALRHEELDEIAAKIVTYIQDRTRRMTLTSADVPALKKDLSVDIYQIDSEWNNGIRNVWSRIFIDSPWQHLEISRPVVKTVTCPKQYYEGHLVFVGKPYFAAFQKVRAPKITSTDSELQLQQEVGAASVLCVDEKMGQYQVFSGYTAGLLKLHFTTTPDGSVLWTESGSSFTATPPFER